MEHHVIKYTHVDGRKLITPTVWCEAEDAHVGWNFVSADHLLLYQGVSIPPCKKCMEAILNVIQDKLKDV